MSEPVTRAGRTLADDWAKFGSDEAEYRRNRDTLCEYIIAIENEALGLLNTDDTVMPEAHRRAIAVGIPLRVASYAKQFTCPICAQQHLLGSAAASEHISALEKAALHFGLQRSK